MKFKKINKIWTPNYSLYLSVSKKVQISWTIYSANLIRKFYRCIFFITNNNFNNIFMVSLFIKTYKK